MLVLAVIVHMLRYAQMGAGPAPLARELGRYAVAGARLLVDVGVLVVLTSSLGCTICMRRPRLLPRAPHQLWAQYCVGVSGAHLAASLGGVRVLYPHWWHRAAGVACVCGCSTEYAHLHYLCSKAGSALVVFLWNFVAKKWLLFHR